MTYSMLAVATNVILRSRALHKIKAIKVLTLSNAQRACTHTKNHKTAAITPLYKRVWMLHGVDDDVMV